MATNYAQPPMGSAIQGESKDPETTMGLLRKLMNEVTTLFRQELALASAELSRSMTKLLASAAGVAVGGVVLFAALLVLLASAVLGLSNVVSPWLAALIVGLAVGIAGASLLMMGLKAIKPSDLKPDRSIRSLKQDKDVLARKSL